MAICFTIWTDSEGYCNAELQVKAESLKSTLREVKELRAMDCGPIVYIQHDSPIEAEDFGDFVSEYPRPIKVKTAFRKFQSLKGL